MEDEDRLVEKHHAQAKHAVEHGQVEEMLGYHQVETPGCYVWSWMLRFIYGDH